MAGKNHKPSDFSLNLFKGGGEMGELMRRYNWSNHPLGTPENWPQSLKMNIRQVLNSSFPMFIWWSRELYMFHNDAYLPALGKKHPEALGARAHEMWQEILEQLEGIVEDILAGGEPFYAEGLLLILERKGFPEETYWTFTYSPAYNDLGEVEGIFCACYEVTNMVLGERRLKALKEVSEATIQIQTLEEACQSVCNKLLENTQDVPFSMIYLLNPAGTEAKLYGFAGDLPQSSIPTIVELPNGASPLPLARVQRSRKMVPFDFSFTSGEGATEKTVQKAVAHPILRPGQDQLIGFFITGVSSLLEYDADYQNFHLLLSGQIATSITSVQAREELARSQGYLKEVFQQAPVGIAIVRGPDYVIDLANPTMGELWGRSPEEVLGKPVLEALPEIKDQGIKQLLDNVVNTGVPFVSHEFPVMLERNGKLEPVYFNFVYHPMRDPQGFVTGVIAVAVGVNEQVEARREIEGMNQELRAINADLDNFVYSASHDLKAPILNIEGLVQALVRYLPKESMEPEMVKRILDLIKASIERFKRTVNDLTEVTKLQRDGSEDVDSIYLPDVVKEVFQDLESLITESRARVETHFQEVPLLQFSAKNVRSIVYNLLSNALKYRSPKRDLYLLISTETTPEFLVLSVTDNGLGMNLTDENKIFSMFKRLHDHVEGSGIGLYIVKKIVENAGGKIEVESEIDKGSTFRVFFKR